MTLTQKAKYKLWESTRSCPGHCCQFRKGGEGNEKPKDNILTRNLKRYFFHYSEITTPRINQTKRNESNLKQRPGKKKRKKKKRGNPAFC